MSEIQIEDVSLLYRDDEGRPVPVVSEVSFEIAKGELLCLLGPSGAGKTSLLRLIGGLEAPSAGKVYLGNRSVGSIRPAERSIYFLSQDGLLYPNLTTYQNLALILERRQVASLEVCERVEALAERFGLGARLTALPETLSRGERQRVCLARALLSEQRILLLDEPLSGVDPERHFFLKQEIVAAWKESGAIVVYVTHDPREAFSLGGRVAVMEGGKLLQIDAAETVYRSPANRFVASFTEYPPMNFLPGKLIHEQGELLFCCRDDHGNQQNSLRFGVAESNAALMGRELVAGVRPDDLEVAPGDGSQLAIEAEIERIEIFSGANVYVLRSGGYRLVLRSAVIRTAQIGCTMKVRIPRDKVLWFDGESNERLG